LVSDIPAGDGKIDNLFYTVYSNNSQLRSIKKLCNTGEEKGKDVGKAQECKYRVLSVVEVRLRPMILTHTRYMANDLHSEEKSKLQIGVTVHSPSINHPILSGTHYTELYRFLNF
jgi:hypothetical protein